MFYLLPLCNFLTFGKACLILNILLEVITSDSDQSNKIKKKKNVLWETGNNAQDISTTDYNPVAQTFPNTSAY